MENENKVIRGITTSKKLKEIMKEKGAEMVTIEGQDNVTAEQFNDLLDTIAGTNITMKATDKTVVEDILNGDAPTPTDVSITINVSGLDEGDVATGTIGNEAIQSFPAEITREEGTTETLEVSCEGYVTVTEEVTFDEDKTVNVTLEKEVEEEYTIIINVDGIEEGDTPTGTIGDEAITEFPAQVVRVSGTTETLTVSCDGYQTVTQEVTFDADKEITITLEKDA